MSLWEYKIITSGKGGFASPALLEKFLNDLGRDQWEIVEFHALPDNFLVFTGLARRPTQRDWTLEDAAAAAAKVEADKLRAEFEAKFKAGSSGAAAESAAETFIEEKVAPDDGFRKPIDTSHDADADEEETKEEDDWDKMTAAEEDELPSFFDAIKPHMRRNQRGPGMSVGVDYLAKKWDQSEEDIKGALAECGFAVPTDEDAKAEYLEFEGDLYWVNVNRRGELWINTKEKPRPVFRAVKGQKVAVEEEQKTQPAPKPAPKSESRKAEAGEQKAAAPESVAPAPDAQPAPSEPGAALPVGNALLDKIRPLMRRNRRGPGGSGSASFLARALKCREADLVSGFKALGLVVPASANEKATNVEIGNSIWWVNVDSRGNVWINGRDKKPGETVEATASSAPAPREGAGIEAPAPNQSTPAADITTPPTPVEAGGVGSTTEPAPTAAASAASEPAAEVPSISSPAADGVLGRVRAVLKETRTGGVAAKLERIAEALEKSPEDTLATLTGAGLVVPEKPREKPVFVEFGGEIFWLNRNAKGELWLNAKASKFADKPAEEAASAVGGEAEADGEKKPRRPRSRKKTE